MGELLHLETARGRGGGNAASLIQWLVSLRPSPQRLTAIASERLLSSWGPEV